MSAPDTGQAATVRGLATVAMLKVNFDTGRDHIAMFAPFVVDTVCEMGNDMAAEDVQQAVSRRHIVNLPLNTMQTLLGRMTKSGYLRREGGRYFKTDKQIVSQDVAAARSRMERRQAGLAERLRESASELGLEIESNDGALALIVAFLGEYHVGLAIDDAPSPGDIESGDPDDVSKETKATAQFLLVALQKEGEDAEIIGEMLEGFVLKNTLFLSDISTTERRFDDLLVFVDSQILFAALGMHGEAAETATTELFKLLRDTGAHLNVFDETIKEMEGILAVYEAKVGTAQGRSSLFPSPLTRHFLHKHATPSDIRTEASLIETKLRKLGFTFRDFPEHVEKWTMDERALGRLLVGDKGENDPRVVHDVGCIAGVLMYRRGQSSASLDKSTAVFMTSSGLTAKNIRSWYGSQGGRGFPPVVHQLAMSNYAWLKRPGSATTLKEHELVALCVAALRPSRKVWSRFLEHLRQLEASGELSEDETTAIVASKLTDNVLAEVDFDEDVDAASLSEVVERVKADYQDKAASELEEARDRATELRDDRDAVRASVDKRASSIATAVGRSVTGLLAVSAVLGVLLTLLAAISGDAIPLMWVVLAVGPLAILGLLGALNGFNLKTANARIHSGLAREISRWLTKDAG